MALDITNWHRVSLVDGAQFDHPDGPRTAQVRVRGRRQPLQTLRAAVDAALVDLADTAESLQLLAVERVSTAEGELAAIAHITGVDNSKPVDRFVGRVWVDDFYTSVDATLRDREQLEPFRTMVHDLLRHYPMGLGHPRRRRFEYAPPPHWFGRPRLLVSDWFPPTFPARHGVITVLPAKPLAREQPADLIEQLVYAERFIGFVRDGKVERDWVASEHGLGGTLIRISGAVPGGVRTFIDTAALVDKHWLYLIRLESREQHLDANRDAFAALIRSATPLPLPELPTRNTIADSSRVFRWLVD